MSAASGIAGWVRGHWPTLRKVLIGGFVVVVIGLLALAAWRVDWGQVWEAARKLPASALWIAYGLTACSFLVYSCYDLLGKHYTGHTLSRLRTLVIACISYAFTMTMGTSVGGLGLRLRLYTGSGVSTADATRVFAFAVTTNWIGYCLVGGALFASGYIEPPADWPVSLLALQIAGGVAIAIVAAYVLCCFVLRQREWKVHGHAVVLPSGPLALAQAGIAALNWCLMAGVLYVLLQRQAPYAMVLGALLLSAVIGLVIRLPAGLGVLEATVMAVLSTPELPKSAALAATLVYRAVYYLTPLFIAGVWYLLTEVRNSRHGGSKVAAEAPRERRAAG